jgi:hypothetical protein
VDGVSPADALRIRAFFAALDAPPPETAVSTEAEPAAAPEP